MKYYENIDAILRLKIFKDLKIDDEFINIVNEELNKIIKAYTIKDLHNRLNNIQNFIMYKVCDEISWLERLNIIVNQLKRDSSSQYSMKIRYGEKQGDLQFKEKNKKCASSLEKYVKKFGDCDGNTKWNERYINQGQSLEKYKRRYGNEIGMTMYSESMRKKKKTITERKLNGKKYKNGRTLDEYITRDGEIIGTQKYNNRNQNHSNRFSAKYYINKFGEVNGIAEWTKYKEKMNKTSISAFIERYGNDIGNEKYKNHLNKLKYHNSLEYYNNKYGTNGELKWNEYRNKTIFKIQKYSKISQELFWKIYLKLSDKQKGVCMFAELNKERFIKIDTKIIFLDFVVRNIAIEFDGEYWHASEIARCRDIEKDKIVAESGFKLLRIPESDYLNNKDLVLENCINYININCNE